MPARFRRVAFAIACSPFLLSPVRASYPDLSKGKPPAVLDARVGGNIRLGPEPDALPATQRGQAEPHLVRSAVNPDVLLATFQEGRYAQGGGALSCGYAISHDGGLTWTHALIPQLTQVNGGPYFRASDPVAAIGPQGDCYLATLVSTNGAFDRASVTVTRSTDDGANWSAPVVVVASPNAQLFPDKNWICANDFPRTSTTGRLAVSWTNYRSTATGGFVGTDIGLAISDDRGATWSAPAAVTPSGANDQGSIPLFLPDGSLVVIYATFFGNTPTFGIRCKRSLDGGRTFPANAATVVNQVNEWDDPVMRHGPYLPSATVARGTGDLFVTYVALVAPGQPRVFVTRSRDKGATWTTPVAVSDQPSGVSVLNPAIAATPDSNTVSVVFMDKRNATDGAYFVDHYAALSFDGGATWQPNLRLTEMSSDVRFAAQTPAGYMLGDYLAVAPSLASDQPCVAIWCDTRSGDADPFVVRFMPTAQPDYAAWAAVRRFGGGQLEDTDGDGVPNYLEFLSATDPQTPEIGQDLVVRSISATAIDVAWTERKSAVKPFAGSIAGYPYSVFAEGVIGIAGAAGTALPSEQLPAIALPDGLEWHGARVPINAGQAEAVVRAFRFSAGVPARNSTVVSTINTDSRLINLSTRGRSGTGASQMIVGFVLDGNKSVLVRAAGPALGALGVSGALADPRLTLSAPASDLQRSNDNWQQSEATPALFARLGAFPFATNSLDAALFLPLGQQNYTAVVSGANNSSGVALVEAYDADPVPGATTGARFLNLSTRGEVGTGDNTLVAGFVVSGTQPRRVLIRAVGPTLAKTGVADTLVDPKLTLFRGTQPVATNDDWEISRSGAAIAATAQRLGAFPLEPASLDAALLTTLAPGNYTVVVSSADGGTGIALVEVYDAD